MKLKQNLFKNDKNKSNVCLTPLTKETHNKLRNRYINICFLNYYLLITKHLAILFASSLRHCEFSRQTWLKGTSINSS